MRRLFITALISASLASCSMPSATPSLPTWAKSIFPAIECNGKVFTRYHLRGNKNPSVYWDTKEPSNYDEKRFRGLVTAEDMLDLLEYDELIVESKEPLDLSYELAEISEAEKLNGWESKEYVTLTAHGAYRVFKFLGGGQLRDFILNRDFTLSSDWKDEYTKKRKIIAGYGDWQVATESSPRDFTQVIRTVRNGTEEVLLNRGNGADFIKNPALNTVRFGEKDAPSELPLDCDYVQFLTRVAEYENR